MRAVVGAVLVLLVGCAPGGQEPATGQAPDEAVAAEPQPERLVQTPSPSRTPRPSPSTTAAPEPPAPEPRRSFVSIPRIGMVDMPVVRYSGTPDDAPGTEIQNTGVMASPRGTAGTVGPGEIGNYVITGHRSSHGAPLLDLPEMVEGDRIRVRSGDLLYVYRVTDTRITSFRSPRSLREQSAAVPGRPGVEPREPMLTLSTCRTPEDRAEGNYWSDEFGNPENRIDKIAVLETVRDA